MMHVDALLSRLVSYPLCILAGAGVSVQAPACLPTGQEFRDGLLKGLADVDTELAGYWSAFLDQEKAQGTQLIRFESLLALVREFFDPELRLLAPFFQCDAPNWYHHALACLMASGSPVLTTNFDCLIEWAATLRGVHYECLVDSTDYLSYSRRLAGEPGLAIAQGPALEQERRIIGSLRMDRKDPAGRGWLRALRRFKRRFAQPAFTRPPPTLIKLHGSPRKPDGTDTLSSICATLDAVARQRQVLNGFPTAILRNRALVVVGYSAWDDFDILPLLRRDARSAPIVWIYHSPGQCRVYNRSELASSESSFSPGLRKVSSFLLSSRNDDVHMIEGESSAGIDRLLSVLGLPRPPADGLARQRRDLGSYFRDWIRERANDQRKRFRFCARVFSSAGELPLAASILQELLLPICSDAPARERGLACSELGLLYVALGNPVRAVQFHMEALDAFRGERDAIAIARERANLGAALIAGRRYEEAKSAIADALPTFKNSGMQHDLAIAYYNLSFVAENLGDVRAMAEYLSMSLRGAKAVGDLALEANALDRLGMTDESRTLHQQTQSLRNALDQTSTRRQQPAVVVVRKPREVATWREAERSQDRPVSREPVRDEPTVVPSGPVNTGDVPLLFRLLSRANETYSVVEPTGSKFSSDPQEAARQAVEVLSRSGEVSRDKLSQRSLAVKVRVNPAGQREFLIEIGEPVL